ncbi:MAG: gfo/Idh/MocA family oxidoreductase, partial [Chloroflexota bacterium]|nr:gfo/Idh/MocA family oxidoreductase [Chloroflexota bacterium]
DAAPESLEAWFPGGIDDAFALEALDWFAAIESGAPAEVDGQAGLRDLAAALAILESDIAHREVTIESVLNGEVDAYQRPIDRELGIRPG